MSEIAASIRALRIKHQLTQAQLAAALGVQYQTVSKWETGTTVPDTMMLPRIADLFRVSIDEVFGRRSSFCSQDIPEETAAFLLRTYSQMYGPEAGPWNLSLENKYLEYRFADFFQKHFTIGENTNLCNIGIGAGEWDIYLSYQLRGGALTSIDTEEICCRQLQQWLLLEENPHTVTVICADAMTLDLTGQFDIVTMVGSTLVESGLGLALLKKAMDFVKPGGALFYQSLDKTEDCNEILQAAYHQEMKLDTLFADSTCGFHCHYYKFSKHCPPTP